MQEPFREDRVREAHDQLIGDLALLTPPGTTRPRVQVEPRGMKMESRGMA